MFGYTQRGELLFEKDQLNRTTTCSYDNVGRMTTKQQPTGDFITNTYDNVGRLVTMQYAALRSHVP